MATFKVQGGNKLSGEIIPQGAKNEALQILCAVLLTSEEVIIENIPNIRDVNILINLLEDLEVKVNKINPNTHILQLISVVSLFFIYCAIYIISINIISI